MRAVGLRWSRASRGAAHPAARPGPRQPGFAQLATLHLDALPVLWLMLGLAFRDRIGRAAWAALIGGGVVMWWLCMTIWLGFQP